MHADAGIGRPRTARDEGHPGAARHRAVGTGHEGNAAFLPAGYHVDRVLLAETIEHLEKAFSGHGEDAVAPLFDKAIDEQSGGGRGVGRLHDSAG